MTTVGTPKPLDDSQGFRARMAIAFTFSRASAGLSVAFVMLMLILSGILLAPLGLAEGARLLAAFLLAGVLPGTALVRRLFGRPTVLHYVIIGGVIGLALWSLGGMTSHLTGLYVARWFPAALGLLLWLLPYRRREDHLLADAHPLPRHAVIGAAVASVGLIPALRSILEAQPASGWTGWHYFYVDLPFQMAITSEVATRVPQEYPWVPDTVLSYPWLFHSGAGVFASTAGVSAADMVLQVWPVLFAVLFPALLALVTWEITRNRWASAVAPVLYVFAHGLVIGEGIFGFTPLFQISPTRDFATFFAVLAVLAFVRVLGRPAGERVGPWWLILLGICVFVATGSKGSAMPILLGGILLAGILLVLLRRVRVRDFIALGVFVFAAVLSTLLVLPDPTLAESLSWGPLTFLSASVASRIGMLAIVALSLFVLAGLAYTLGRSEEAGLVPTAVLIGVGVAGMLGVSLLAHPGSSQLYFWQSSQPIVAIAVAWVFALLARHGVRRLLVTVAVIAVVSNVAMAVQGGGYSTRKILVTGALVLVLGLVGAVYLTRTSGLSRAPGGSWRARAASWFGVLAVVGVLAQSAQMLSIPVPAEGGGPSEESNVQAIHSSQLAAYEYIKQHSGVDDVLITNKHCVLGAIADDDCIPIWFSLAAWTDRHVLVDGWGYTQRGPEPDWIQQELDLSDRFIASPTIVDKNTLISLGVVYVYVDKRLDWSPELADFGDLVFEGEWANVYRLNK